MKKLIMFLIPLFFLFNSCITQKRCNEKFPPISKVEYIHDSIHDSIYVTEIKRDTIVEIKVGRDTTIYDTDTVIINKGVVNSNSVTVNGEYAKATAWVKNSKIVLKLEEFSKVLKLQLKDVITERNTYESLYKHYYKESKGTKVITKNSRIANISIGIVSALLLVLITYLIVRFKWYKILFK